MRKVNSDYSAFAVMCISCAPLHCIVFVTYCDNIMLVYCVCCIEAAEKSEVEL